MIKIEKRKERKKGVKQINRHVLQIVYTLYFNVFAYAIGLVNFSDHAHGLQTVQDCSTFALRMKTACSLWSSQNQAEIFGCWCLPEKYQVYNFIVHYVFFHNKKIEEATRKRWSTFRFEKILLLAALIRHFYKKIYNHIYKILCVCPFFT